MILVNKFIFNSFGENTYVVWDKFSRASMIIDPGCSDQNEERELENFILSKNLTIKYLLNTHCHIDHILGCSFVKEICKVPYYAPKEDIPLIEYYDKQAESCGITVSRQPPLPEYFITEDLKIKLGNCEPVFLFTPGHSPGEYCICFPRYKICFTGDVLFRNSIGRTDLWGGDYNILLHSIRNKLFNLPDDTKIYPGHGEDSTIGYEKKYNPFLID